MTFTTLFGISLEFVLRGCFIGDGCVPFNAINWNEVGTVDRGTEAVEHETRDSEATTQANKL